MVYRKSLVLFLDFDFDFPVFRLLYEMPGCDNCVVSVPHRVLPQLQIESEIYKWVTFWRWII